ncbi:MAG: pantetheine-phosphate adenylyltransferase [SAR86 cluster bacterium]|uniref:Phosphopantetheine adenylyltransferase n=1 Tax=SAR86 cluster bacterium TaxID=2030880 RepID=A0A2A5CHX7_9GAMM|nr:pantetheine-phosphate adenylyltransferase [Gammaproteobacteria bacterium AH-315-E17]PCJ43487.1 MAG: pantetheine-phosphate adenylyltransferase [SAR86 cluster bacterium]
MKTVVYPGTFNPITNGHTDLVKRASRIFDHVIVAIGSSSLKTTDVSLDLRVKLASDVLAHMPNVEVCGFKGLLTDFVKSRHANLILRGLRTVADFEYEFQLVGMNRVLDPSIETVFLVPAEHLAYISSTLVREIASLGGDISEFVDPIVMKAMPNMLKDED